MKSKTSCFNKTIFKKNFTRFWVIWAGILLWNLFVLPCNIFINYLHQSTWGKMTEVEIEAEKISVITGLIDVYMNPTLLFIFAVAAAMAVFSYLYTFRAANTMHALPVTRKELFVTNYVSGLLFLLLPLLIGFLSGTLVSAACGYTCLDYLLKGMLYAIGLSFFFYTFAVFVAMVAGTLAAVPIFTFILNYLYVGTKLLIELLIDCISYGVSIEFNRGKMDILSPLYYLNHEVGFDYDYSGRYAVCTGIFGGKAIVGYAIAAILFLAGAYLIYKKRDIETAGNLISVPWIIPIFRWGSAFCGAVLLGVFTCQLISVKSAAAEFGVAVVSALIYGCVIFFLVQMLLEKGVRVFKKKRFIELGAFFVFLFVAMFAVEKDWFGIEKQLPETEEIERAYIYRSYPVGGDTKEDIAAIREIHTLCIENKQKFESEIAQITEDSEMTSISVKYFLKDGSIMCRDYTIPVEETEPVYQMVKSCTTTAEAYLENQFAINYQECAITEGGIDLYEGEEYLFYEFTDEEVQKVYQAFLADLEAGNFDWLLEHYQYYDENYDNKVYYDSLSFEFSSEENLRYIYDEYYMNRNEFTSERYYNSTKEGNTSIEFTTECENIIQALIEVGAIESEEDLITHKERQETEEL